MIAFNQEELFKRGVIVQDMETKLKLLKKSIPRKAIPEYGKSTFPTWYECPECKAMIDDDYLYCNKCGQAILWEVE